MLQLLLNSCLAAVAPQESPRLMAEAVAVRGETELNLPDAFESARRRVELVFRDRWLARATRLSTSTCPCWLPDLVVDQELRRWLAELPIEEQLHVVEREDQQREHEFGHSYQTTLWVAEEPAVVHAAEKGLRERLRHLERTTAWCVDSHSRRAWDFRISFHRRPIAVFAC
jgi:hypothetical protein